MHEYPTMLLLGEIPPDKRENRGKIKNCCPRAEGMLLPTHPVIGPGALGLRPEFGGYPLSFR